MIYPSLVRKSQCRTPITITVYGDINENGAPEIIKEVSLFCNYQSSVSTIYTAEKNAITINATAFLIGDPFPELADIKDGEVIVFGNRQKIYRSAKCRNDDGSVNYTRLDLV